MFFKAVLCIVSVAHLDIVVCFAVSGFLDVSFTNGLSVIFAVVIWLRSQLLNEALPPPVSS